MPSWDTWLGVAIALPIFYRGLELILSRADTDTDMWRSWVLGLLFLSVGAHAVSGLAGLRDVLPKVALFYLVLVCIHWAQEHIQDMVEYWPFPGQQYHLRGVGFVTVLQSDRLHIECETADGKQISMFAPAFIRQATPVDNR